MREALTGGVREQELSPELQIFESQLEAEYGLAFSLLDAGKAQGRIDQLPDDVEKAQETQIDQLLAEVKHLRRLRGGDGEHLPAVLEGVYQNLLTAVKEAAMPCAVSTVYHELVNGTYWWLDQDPVDVARSGKTFHKSSAALQRVEVEIEEAVDVRDNLHPGMIKVFISPRMSRKDVSYEVAKQEHLADDDMLRIHMLDIDEATGEVRGKFMQSLLVSDIPLNAWVRMFKDPHNIFGRSFELEDEDSALSVMKLHHELELPETALPEGAISLIEAVLPYMDETDRAKTETRLPLYRSGQDDLHKKAESIADRWLAFEIGLADSLDAKRATPEITSFIYQLQHQWSDPMLALLAAHRLPDGGMSMTRELVAKLEEAQRNILWTTAAVVTSNEKVLNQLDKATVQEICRSEQAIQVYVGAGYSHEFVALQATMNRLIAANNVDVGGGCAGRNAGRFASRKGSARDDVLGAFTDLDFEPFREDGDKGEGEDGGTNNAEDKKQWVWTNGVCRVEACPTRPATTKVGPCAVCRRCQSLFDQGQDPTQGYVPAPPTKPQKRTGVYLMDIIFKPKAQSV